MGLGRESLTEMGLGLRRESQWGGRVVVANRKVDRGDLVGDGVGGGSCAFCRVEESRVVQEYGMEYEGARYAIALIEVPR